MNGRSTEDSRGSEATPCDIIMLDVCPYARVRTHGTQAPGVTPIVGDGDVA